MSSQQQEIEKVRIDVQKSEIPAEEITDLVSANDKLWRHGENTKFENALLDKLEITSPTFCNILQEGINKPENQGKKVSFSFEGFQFGIREDKSTGYKMVWRLKLSGGGGGYNSGNKSPPMPLAEIWVGTADAANDLLKDESKRWYLADQKIQVENSGIPQAFVILKRNRFIGQP